MKGTVNGMGTNSSNEPDFGRLDGEEFAESPEARERSRQQYAHRKLIQPPPANLPIGFSRISIDPMVTLSLLGERWNEEMPKWTGTTAACIVAVNALMWVFVMVFAASAGWKKLGLWICICVSALSAGCLIWMAVRWLLRRRKRKKSE